MKTFRFRSFSVHGTQDQNYPQSRLLKTTWSENANGGQQVKLIFEGDQRNEAHILTGDDAEAWRKFEDRDAFVINQHSYEKAKTFAEDARNRAEQERLKREREAAEAQAQAEADLKRLEAIRQKQKDAEEAFAKERARQIQDRVKEAGEKAKKELKEKQIEAAKKEVEEAQENLESVTKKKVAKKKTIKKKAKG